MTDVERFEAFVRTYQDLVFATAVRLLGNPAEAEDVVQSVFLKAFEQFDTIGSSPAAAGWVRTVARNACLNHLSRYRSRWRFFSELGPADENADSPYEASLAGTDSPAHELEQKDERERLEQALRRLPGTRVNKNVNLTDDLALALEALRVRIVAPIPGKAAVGIEVPNKTREKVFIKEILADEVFRKSHGRLPMAIGKDIEGAPFVVDMARMPHLLVAGTTGSGKSVGVNAMITSLLYHCSPEDVRMIMVDPKMLELSIYEGIPHLLLPVVTDPKKANLALRWAVEEMERRYDLLAQQGVRDINGYNEKIAKSLAKLEVDKLREAANAAARALEEDLDKVVSSDSPEAADAREKVNLAQTQHKLPFIVVVIDEFADLMMCAPKEVETSVARIAQKARAAGIHLILATQRPSVDVITGLIKANFPSRIAFSVASKIDSRTILDQNGAEALLGAGDMLFSDRGASPVRLHGCYIDETEIHRVVSHLKTQGRPVYNLDIIKPRDEEGEGGEFGGGGAGGGSKSGDDMYDKAVYIVTTTRNASISWVQRQLRIGYNRAARIVEEMEKQGVVSAPDHTNKREVLVAQA
jgi:S-DNA-T family DNA segregation ATPase FtsK/SpoIIIE